MTRSSSASAPYGTKRATPSSCHPGMVSVATTTGRLPPLFQEAFPAQYVKVRRPRAAPAAGRARRHCEERPPAQHDPPVERGGHGTSPQRLRDDHEVATATALAAIRLGEADRDPTPRHEVRPQLRVVPQIRGTSLSQSTVRRRGEEGCQAVTQILCCCCVGERLPRDRGGRGRGPARPGR